MEVRVRATVRCFLIPPRSRPSSSSSFVRASFHRGCSEDGFGCKQKSAKSSKVDECFAFLRDLLFNNRSPSLLLLVGRAEIVSSRTKDEEDVTSWVACLGNIVDAEVENEECSAPFTVSRTLRSGSRYGSCRCPKVFRGARSDDSSRSNLDCTRRILPSLHVRRSR